MKTKMIIIITSIAMASVIVISLYGIQIYSEPFRESTLELRFEEKIITVLIRDETHISTNYTELTTIPTSSLVKAHDRLPKTSSADRIIAGSIVSETEKSGTYLTEDGFKEFWYTIDDGNSYETVTIELQDHEFDRMVFDSEKSQELIYKINEIVFTFESSAESEQFTPHPGLRLLNQDMQNNTEDNIPDQLGEVFGNCACQEKAKQNPDTMERCSQPYISWENSTHYIDNNICEWQKNSVLIDILDRCEQIKKTGTFGGFAYGASWQNDTHYIDNTICEWEKIK